MPGGDESHGDGLEHTGHAEDGPGTAGSVSRAYVGGPEADMRYPEPDGWPEEVVPGEFKRMAADPLLLVAQGCEVLNLALDADIAERGSLVALARAWLRAAEIAGRIQAQE